MLKVVGASWMQIRMSTWIIGVVLVLGVIVVILGQMGHSEEDGNYSATAFWNKETGFEIKFWGQGMDIEQIPKGAARVYFQPHTDTTGWAIIDILTQANYPDWVQAYAAGMLEGSISWQLIYWQWKNTVQSTCETRQEFCQYVRKYLEENLESVKENYQDEDDPYWYQVHLFYVQLEGLKQGFEQGVKRSRQTIEELDFVDFMWMNAASDIKDLEYRFLDTKPYTPTFNQTNSQNILFTSLLVKKIRSVKSVDGSSTGNQPSVEGRPLVGCGATLGSALVKILPEQGQLIVAHNSAGPYMSMLKMIKHYNFKYHWSGSNFWTVQNKISFSSYPGALHSMDDFYVISVGSEYIELVIAGTPLTVFNKDLWKHVSPRRQVLSGPRAMVASRMSKNATVWAETVSRYNSGTGNKEWMIIDAEKFHNLSRLRKEDQEMFEEELRKAKDILWVTEQIPGHFVMEDQTDVLLRRTYWASYGLPFYKNISELSGADTVRESHGDAFSYTNAPPARIYRRDHQNATSVASAMRLMRSNSYMRDPLSLGNPRCAIGARGDIPNKASYSFPIGVTDSKVFSIGGELAQNETAPSGILSRFQVVAGPAYSHPCLECNEEDGVKPFSWTDSIFSDFPHNGHPDSWVFNPINIS